MADRAKAQQAAALFPLRSISIGIWATRKSRKWLLCLPNRRAFVLLICCNEAKAETPWGRVWHHAIDKRNPFSPCVENDAQAHTVIALEVQWSDIQGMDYTFPLHQDGRLVLESKKIIKRTFRTVLEAQQFYDWRPAGERGLLPSKGTHAQSSRSAHGHAESAGGTVLDNAHQPTLRSMREHGPGTGLAPSRSLRRAGLPPAHTSTTLPGAQRAPTHVGPSHSHYDGSSGSAPSTSSVVRVGRGTRMPRIVLNHHHDSHGRRTHASSRKASMDQPRTATPHSSGNRTGSSAGSAADLRALDAQPDTGVPTEPTSATSAATPTARATGATLAPHIPQPPIQGTLPPNSASNFSHVHPLQRHSVGKGVEKGWASWLSAWSAQGNGQAGLGGSRQQPKHGALARSSMATPFTSSGSVQQLAEPTSMLPCGMDLHGDTSWSNTPGLTTPNSRMSLEFHAGPGRPSVLAHVSAPVQGQGTSHTHAHGMGHANGLHGSAGGGLPMHPLRSSQPHMTGIGCLQPRLGRKAVSAQNLAAMDHVHDPHASAQAGGVPTLMQSALPEAKSADQQGQQFSASFQSQSIQPAGNNSLSRLSVPTLAAPHGFSRLEASSIQQSAMGCVPGQIATNPQLPAKFTQHAHPHSPVLRNALWQGVNSHGYINTSISRRSIDITSLRPASTALQHVAAHMSHMEGPRATDTWDVSATSLMAMADQQLERRTNQRAQKRTLMHTASSSRSGAQTVSQVPPDIPPACRWTAASAVYPGRTLVVTFRDPAMQPMLSQVVKSDVRILQLYESGLPAWAVFLPSYGLWYRPWMRQVTFLLFTAISIASMILGFYDLYKNVPIVRQAMAALSARIFPPATQLFEWLEKHAQIRLSILLTYLFSKSPLFISLMRFLRTCMGSMSQLMGPLLSFLRTALAPLTSLVTYLASSLAYLLQPLASFFTACGGLLSACGSQLLLLGSSLASGAALLLAPPAQALWTVLLVLGRAGRVLGQFGVALVQGPAYMLGQLAAGLQTLGGQLGEQLRLLAATLGLMWRAVFSWAKAAKAAAPAAAATGRAVVAAARATPTPSTTTWSVFARMGQEVWGLADFARITLFRCVKALQAVTNFFIAMALAVNRHRVSLLMELRSYLLTHPGNFWVPRVVASRIIHTQPSAHFSLVPGELLDEAGEVSAPEGSTGPTSPQTNGPRTGNSLDSAVSPAVAGVRPFRSRLGVSEGRLGLSAARLSLDAGSLLVPSAAREGNGHLRDVLGMKEQRAAHMEAVNEIVLRAGDDIEGEAEEEWRGLPVGGAGRTRAWQGQERGVMVAGRDMWHEMVSVGHGAGKDAWQELEEMSGLMARHGARTPVPARPSPHTKQRTHSHAMYSVGAANGPADHSCFHTLSHPQYQQEQHEDWGTLAGPVRCFNEPLPRADKQAVALAAQGTARLSVQRPHQLNPPSRRSSSCPIIQGPTLESPSDAIESEETDGNAASNRPAVPGELAGVHSRIAGASLATPAVSDPMPTSYTEALAGAGMAAGGYGMAGGLGGDAARQHSQEDGMWAPSSWQERGGMMHELPWLNELQQQPVTVGVMRRRGSNPRQFP